MHARHRHREGDLADASYRGARSVDELTERNVRAIARLDEEARAQRGPASRFAGIVTRWCGSIAFAAAHAGFFAAWIAYNSVPGWFHFDPYPFTFLTLVVSLEAIFLSTFILVAQNEENRLAERRNALDLQINLLTEQENTKMLRMLQAVARQVGAKLEEDPALAALEQATRPDRLAEQIDRVTQAPK
jgi:uncharacterized membrane protein